MADAWLLLEHGTGNGNPYPISLAVSSLPSLPGHFPLIAIAPPTIAMTTSIPRRGRPWPLPGGVTKDMINVPTHATHTTAPINRNAIVRLLGIRHATAIIAGNKEVLPITIQVSGGVCSKSIKPEKTKRTTAKTRQSQPAMSGKILRDVFNSATPKVMREIHFF